MDLTIHATFLPHDDPEAALAFYRDTLGFEVRNDVGYQGLRWITVGPPAQPGTSIVLHPPGADPGITDDERRTIAEMMAKGTYGSLMLATKDVDGTFDQLQARGAEVVQEPVRPGVGRARLCRPRPRGEPDPYPGAALMSLAMTTGTETQTPPRLHAADSHDLIRVHGARENNLKDLHVELPKRRLTVFTGVSGSGKSSLVFGTIAAESQRLINETYSAFVQGFMPTLARPEVDLLDGLTTAIIVDQERMGANARSTVGTVTDANAMLRILFSRLGQPHIGPPNAYSFNVPSVKASGSITVERGGKTKAEKATFTRLGGMCPRCEGMGSVTDFELSALYDDTKSLAEGALAVPGYSMDGWYGRIFGGAGLPMDKPIGRFTKRELHELLYGEPEKIKVEGINLTYEGVIPKIQKSMLSKDVDALQPHVRAFVQRAVTFTTCPDCDGTRLSAEARSSRIQGKNIADACAMQISDLAGWIRGLDEPSVAPLLAGLQHLFDSFAEIGLGYLSLDRPSGTLSGGEAQRTKMIRHLGSSLTDVTYVFDEPTSRPAPARRRADERPAAAAAGQGQHGARRGARAGDDRDRRPRRRPRSRRGICGRRRLLRGHCRGAAGQRHGHRPSSRRPGRPARDGADAHRQSGHPRRVHSQPARRRCRRPARGARRRHRGRRLRQELADPRLALRTGRGGGDRPGRDPRLAAEQPGDLHRPARPDPQGVREGKRGEAGALQRQLRGCLPDLQRRRRDLHRPGDDGRCRHHL